jgi:hypothetical protein
VRFTLLLASTALAASIGLAACSSGGSQAIPGVGGSTTTQAPDNHHGLKFNDKLHIVFMRAKGQMKSNQSCPYTACFELPAGYAGYGYVGWCISDSGNCSSGLLPGKWEWLNVICYSTYDCVILPNNAKVIKLKTGEFSGAIKVKWDPKVANPTEQLVVWKASLKPSKTGDPTYGNEFAACAKSGPYKGECTGIATEGWIPE